MAGCVRWNNFFDRYNWAENKKVRFAKMKLIGRANLFWEDVEDTLVLNLQPLIIDWPEMKVILLKNYLPPTYKSSLLNEWDCLKQGTSSVMDYIE